MKSKAAILKDVNHDDIPCAFTEMSKKEFWDLVQIAKRSLSNPRLKIDVVANAKVHCTVRSNSGKSRWRFTLDFNDYGHITGVYWEYSGNHESDVPEQLGHLISYVIRQHIGEIETGRGYTSPGQRLYVEEEQYEDRIRKEEKDRIRQERAEEIQWQKHVRRERHRDWRREHWKGLLGLIIVLTIVCGAALFIHDQKQLREVGTSSKAFVGMNCEDAEKLLNDAGFNSVYKVAENDLTFKELDKEGSVIKVVIAGSSNFEEDTKFRYDSDVKITYHAANEIYPPMTSEEAEGKYYKDVEKTFLKAGFGNVNIKPVYKRFTSILKREGKVLAIYIKDSSEYSKSGLYTVNEEVTIAYRTSDEKYKDKK